MNDRDPNSTAGTDPSPNPSRGPMAPPPVPRPTRRSSATLLVVTFGALALFVLLIVSSFVGSLGQMVRGSSAAFEEALVDGNPRGKKKLLMIPVSGVILDGEAGPLGGSVVTSPWRIRRVLELARKDDDIRGVLLLVNSPGGGVTASDTILQELRTFKEESGLPIVAFFKDVAASGGYYVAMAADRIVSHPTGITGSIGVIMRMLNYRDLYAKLGLSEETIVSDDTPYKDMGSPTRKMRPDERAKFEAILQEMYERFVTIVDQGRPSLDTATVRALANGSIYSAGEAKELGLVDTIGYREEALSTLRELAEVDEDAPVVTYQQVPGLLESLLMKSGAGRSNAGIESGILERLLPSRSGLLYLWPGFGEN